MYASSVSERTTSSVPPAAQGRSRHETMVCSLDAHSTRVLSPVLTRVVTIAATEKAALSFKDRRS